MMERCAMYLARFSGVALAATFLLLVPASSLAEDKGIDTGAVGPPITVYPPPIITTDGVIRVSQESAPLVGDFDANILGELTAFECDESALHFYGYDHGCYNGCYVKLRTERDRSLLFFAVTTEGMTLFVVHDAVRLDPEGGNTEMLYRLSGDPDGAYFSAQDDPATPFNQDRYTGYPGATLFSATHDWAPLRTDGEAISDLEEKWTMIVSFTDLDGDPATPTIYGINSWVALSALGHEIPLALEEDRRVRLEFVPACTTDVIEDGETNFADLLQLLSSWGPCP
jgi:hypothetical protein